MSIFLKFLFLLVSHYWDSGFGLVVECPLCMQKSFCLLLASPVIAGDMGGGGNSTWTEELWPFLLERAAKHP